MAEEAPAYFLDTSALVKLYHEERGSDVLEPLAADVVVSLSISDVARVEFHSALLRKVREGQLTEVALDEVLACFREDLDHRFNTLAIAGATFDNAIALLLQYGTKWSLRTLDALQIAAAQAVGNPNLTFVTADTTLFTVASQIFEHVMNPETVSAAP